MNAWSNKKKKALYIANESMGIFEHFVYILVLQVAKVLYGELSTIWHGYKAAVILD